MVRASNIGTCLIFLVVAAGLRPDRGSAQEREVSLDSLEQAVQLEGGVDDLVSDFRISGFGVANFGYVSETNDNTFAASKLAIAVFKRAGAYVSFFGQLTALFEFEGSGGEIEEEPVEGEEEGGHGPPLETEIDNLILSVTTPGFTALTFWLGRFDAPIGFERDDEPLNFQPTNSFNFEFARPIKFTGLLARYTPIPEVSMAGYVVNGWDVTIDNNKGKTVGARVTYFPDVYAQVSVNGIYGPEKDENTQDKRLLLTADFTAQPAQPLILGGEFNFGTEQNSAVGGGDADWIGGQITGFVRLAHGFGVTLRYDVFDDRDGSRTGQAQTLQSFTVAPMVFFRSAVTGIFSTVPGTRFALPQFQVRAGLRYNKSDQPFFHGEDELVDHNVAVLVEGVFVF